MAGGPLFGKAPRRFDLLFNPMKLSEALGYDFHIISHGEELVASVGPRILPVNPSSLSSEVVPFFELDKLKNRLVLWPRGHFKTSAVVLYIVNLILAYPDIRILLMQGAVPNTKGLLREIKSHFDGTNQRSTLPKDFPRWCQTDVRLGNVMGFVSPARQRTHLKEYTVGIASPRTTKTGQHYEAGFFDDLVNDQNFRNPLLQQKTIDEFNSYTPLIEPGGYKTVTGTRYAFGDLYGHLIKQDAERRDWSISVRNCWKNSKDASEGVLFPQVQTAEKPPRTIGFTEDVLRKIQKDDPEMFSYQYLNQPIVAGQETFNEELLLSAVRPVEEILRILGPKTLFVDIAASKSAASDNSVIVAGAQDAGGNMYVCDIRAGKYSSLELANHTIDMCLRHRPMRVSIEGTAAGRYFIEYLRLIAASRGLTVPIEEIKVSNTKDAKHLRISAVAGVLKLKKLFFLVGLSRWDELVEQFLEFPRGRHDDEIDTISLMVQTYTSTTDVYRHAPPNTFAALILRAPEAAPLVAPPRVPDPDSCGSDFLTV